MNRSATALVLAKIAAIDNRRLDPPDGGSTPILDAWHEVIGDLGFQDCIEAVTAHRCESREWIQPADIRQRVLAVRAKRHTNIDDADLTEDVDPNDIPAYLATLRARRQAIGDGMPLEDVKELPLPTAAAHALVNRTERPVILARQA